MVGELGRRPALDTLLAMRDRVAPSYPQPKRGSMANIEREARRLNTLADELDTEAEALKAQAIAVRQAATALEEAPRPKRRRRSPARRPTATSARSSGAE